MQQQQLTKRQASQRMRRTREWLIEEGHDPEKLWPEWYPVGTLPLWDPRNKKDKK